MDVSCCYSLPTVMHHRRALATTAVRSLQQQRLLPENDVSTKTSSLGPKITRLTSCSPSSTIEESRRWRYSISLCHTNGSSLLFPTELLLAPCCSSPVIPKRLAPQPWPSLPHQASTAYGPVPILLTRRPLMRLDRIGSFSKVVVSSRRGRFQVIVLRLPTTG